MRGCRSLVLGVVAAGVLIFASIHSVESWADGEHVKVVESIPFSASANTYYSAKVTYDFHSLGDVYVTGMGSLPSHGTLTQIWWNKTLEFRDTQGGLLATVELQPTAHLQGGSPEIPPETSFSAAVVSRTCAYGACKAQLFRDALNTAFPFGYTVKQESDRLTYVTTYQDLDGLPSNLRGQVAVMLSFRRSMTRSDTFDLRSVARERGRKSLTTKWYDPSDVVVGRAQAVVSGLSTLLVSGHTK